MLSDVERRASVTVGQGRKGLKKKRVNRIDIAVQSENVGEGIKNLLNFYLHGDSARANVHVTDDCHS